MTGAPPAPPVACGREGVAARLPHRGPMMLLDALVGWDDESIRCTAVGHADPRHPLRTAGGLLAPCAIEYAAQAMALHGALLAERDEGQGRGGPAPTPGMLASVRDVRLAVARLDDAAGPLAIRAARLAGDAAQILYRFEVDDAAGRRLADGRATVVLRMPPEHGRDDR